MGPSLPIRVAICGAAFAACLASPGPAVSAETAFRGQASAWVSQVYSLDEWHTPAGIHYLPQITLEQAAGREAFIDLAVSLEAYAEAGQPGRRDTALVDVYRLKLRFATPRTETRTGLQQINFGPAYLLRSIRWFDSLDPRDPLGLTDGVYALTFKYVAQSNMSIWLWGLYGNDEPKGQEILPTLEGKVEVGGRFELPLPSGEGAFTYHGRRVDGPGPFVGDFNENRFGMDGRWDIKLGVWFEAALIQQDSDDLPYTWRKMITLGADYTFPVGNGLHLLLEHMAIVSSNEALGWDADSNISGLSFGYPLGYSDQITFIPFYFWEDKEYSLYAAWAHHWDNFTLNVIGSRYPETGEDVPASMAKGPGGYGAQMMLIFNH
jgi:hypothetical protein